MTSVEASEDDVLELTPTLTAPEVHNVRKIETGHDRASTSAIRHRTGQDDLDHLTAGAQKPVRDHDGRRTPGAFSHSGSGNQYIGGQQTIIFAPENRPLFDPLVLRGDQSSGRQTARINKLKASYRTARLVSNSCSFKWLFG